MRLDTSFEPDVVSALSSLANVKELTLTASVPPIIKNPFLYVPRVAKRNPNPNRKREIHPQVVPPPRAIERVLAAHRLRSLTLDGFQLADADYAQISRHASLEEVAIEITNIPEDALPKLLRLPRLRRFCIHECEVTGKDLATTPSSLSLQSVHCERTPVGVEFAAFLARCPKLQDLSLQHLSVNDDFVKLLENHPGIQMLMLHSASVTDACIPSLERLPSIRCLYLPGDGFSSTGKKRLRTALNGVDVRFN